MSEGASKGRTEEGVGGGVRREWGVCCVGREGVKR